MVRPASCVRPVGARPAPSGVPSGVPSGPPSGVPSGVPSGGPQRSTDDAEARELFDTIEQDVLMAPVSRRVSDRRMRQLVGRWLRAGVMTAEGLQRTVAETPQGGVIDQ